MKLGLVIPLFDEAQGVEKNVTLLSNELTKSKIDHVLVLVNNGSSDSTGSKIEKLKNQLPNIITLHLEQNKGYGGGILKGLELLNTDAIGWHWGDGQIDPVTVIKVYNEVRNGALFAKAKRTFRQDGLRRITISKVYNAICTNKFNLPEDVNGCPKIFQKEIIESLSLNSKDWLLDIEALIKTEQLGITPIQIETTMKIREGGASKVRLSTIALFIKAIINLSIGSTPWK